MIAIWALLLFGSWRTLELKEFSKNRFNVNNYFFFLLLIDHSTKNSPPFPNFCTQRNWINEDCLSIQVDKVCSGVNRSLGKNVFFDFHINLKFHLNLNTQYLHNWYLYSKTRLLLVKSFYHSFNQEEKNIV